MFSQRRKTGPPELSLLERSLAALASTATAGQSSESADSLIGPYGLNLLYAPPVPLVDLIFVHGLRGGSRKTWSKTSDPLSYWPKEWLPRDPTFKNARIFSFGYNSDWGDKKDSVLNIHDFGKSLLSEIMNSPEIMKDVETRIVFIGHSMGGLVVKQTHILASQDPAAKSIADRVYGIVFLATPHRGADLAKVLGNILKASIMHSQKPFVSDLERNSVMLSLINDEFRHYSTKLELFSFYETVETRALGLSSTLIVSKDSATLGYPNEKNALLNATHRNVCKFDTPLDPNYVSLRNLLAAITMRATEQVNATKRDQRRADLLKLQSYLGVGEIPEDDLTGLEDVKLEGSCQWLSWKKKYLAWRDSHPGSLPYYWLNAQQATGKSIMAAHVIRDLEAVNAECSYYFFKHNDRTKISLSGCLRSLAYQMALTDLGIFQRLMLSRNDEVRLDLDNELAVWRKIFVNGIFEVSLNRPHFWVVDGLDECSSPNSLAFLLSKVSSGFPLRVFVTSRPLSEIFRDFTQIKTSLHIDEMTADDTRCDIENYIQACVKDFSLQDDDCRKKVGEVVLQKSSGSFLWVALVLEEIRSAYSVANVEHILRDVPPGMDPLYERALKLLSKAQRGKHLIKAILRWTVNAIRPLNIKELEHALQLDLGENVLTLDKFIGSTCWQFVQVEKSGRVSLIHETVRVFLLREDLQSEFAVDRIGGHGRITDICLLYLGSNEMKPPRNQKLMHLYRLKASKRGPFMNYACEYFSQHLRRSHSGDPPRFSSLCEFLAGNVSSWIEHIAVTRNLQPLIQAARDLKGFLQARAKYHSPIGKQVQLVDAWESDLVHLVAQFGRYLMESPSAIFWLIPPFCPTTTAIRSQFTSASNAISVKGLTSLVWSDRISCIQYRDLQARAVACADTTFTVGLSDKSIRIYSRSTCQELRQVTTSQSAKLLTYSDSGKVLAVISVHFLTVFNQDSGQQLWQVQVPHECLEIVFADQDRIIWLVTKRRILASLSVADGSKLSSILLRDPSDEEAEIGFRQIFTVAAFSLELRMVAAVQRGRPISLYDMDEGMVLGVLDRDPAELEQEDRAPMWIRDFVFRSDLDSSFIAVLYHDGQLVLFDPCELTTKAVVSADAHILACSPDGRTLATGSLTGTIQIFDFEPFTLIYKLIASDYSIKSLAFSSDGLRFVDIRGSQCNVWEPSILMREISDENDSVSDTVAATPTVVGIASLEDEADITALACHRGGKFVACGKDNGVVTLYSTQDGAEIGVLYNHAQGTPINFLIFSNDSSLIVSADASSRVMVWRLLGSDNTWSAEGPLLDVRVQDYSINQTLLDSTNKRLLVSTIASDITYDIENGLRNSTTLKERSSWKWILHPRDPQKLIHLTASAAHVHTWDNVSEAQFCPEFGGNFEMATDLGDEMYLKDVAVCSDGCKLSVEFAKGHRDQSTSQVIVILSSVFEEPYANVIKPLPLFENISAEIEHIIGSLGTALFFLDRRMWVCSLDLEKFKGEYFRHFFIPEDWLSVNRTLILKISATGDFIFVKKHEVAVVKNGLENKEIVSIGVV